MTKNNRKIKNILIYPRFQWRMILLFMLVSLVGPLIILGFQIYTFQSEVASMQALHLPDSHPFFVFYNRFETQAVRVFVLALALSFSLCLGLGLWFSHRIAGPLVKLRGHFVKVAQAGRDERCLDFRKDDDFRDLAEAYNKRFKS